MPNKRKKMRQGKRKNKGGEKAKSKSEDCCVTFKPHNSKFCFLRMPELCKLLFCIWIRRPRRVWPVNGFVVKLQNAFFGKISRAEWVKSSGVKISVRVWYHDFVAIGNVCDITWSTSNHERMRYHMIMRQRTTWKVSRRQVCSVRASSPPGVSCERHVRGDAPSRGWRARQSRFAWWKQWPPFSIFSPVPRDTQQETNFSNMFTAIISFIWDLKKNSLASQCLVKDIRKELRSKRKEPFWMLCFD